MEAVNLSKAETQKAISTEVQNLDSTDSALVAKSSGELFLLSKTPEISPEALDILRSAIPKLVSLLSSDNLLARRNTFATLTALLSSSEECFRDIAQSNDVASAICNALRETKDEIIVLNAANLLAGLAQENEGRTLVLSVPSEEALLSAVTNKDFKDDNLFESLLDAVCSLSTEESVRPRIVGKGFVPALCRFLGSDVLSFSNETKVRALIALAMLVGSDETAQEQFVNSEKSISNLAKLMRSEDVDLKVLSADFFSSLAKKETLRAKMEEALRNTATQSC